MYYFVHIPKTGGMWFRKFVELNPQYNIETTGFHGARLFDATHPAIFCLRDPIDRFLSGLRMRWLDHRHDDIVHQVDYFLANKERETSALNLPMTRYIGDMETYKQHEHNIAVVFDFENYPYCVYDYFTDANRDIENIVINDTARSVNYNKTKYDLRSDQLTELNSIYADDIELYEYIKTRSYYASNES